MAQSVAIFALAALFGGALLTVVTTIKRDRAGKHATERCVQAYKGLSGANVAASDFAKGERHFYSLNIWQDDAGVLVNQVKGLRNQPAPEQARAFHSIVEMTDDDRCEGAQGSFVADYNRKMEQLLRGK